MQKYIEKLQRGQVYVKILTQLERLRFILRTLKSIFAACFK